MGYLRLDYWNLFKWDLNSKITTCHHDTIRSFYDLFQVLKWLQALNFCQNSYRSVKKNNISPVSDSKSDDNLDGFTDLDLLDVLNINSYKKDVVTIWNWIAWRRVKRNGTVRIHDKTDVSLLVLLCLQTEKLLDLAVCSIENKITKNLSRF